MLFPTSEAQLNRAIAETIAATSPNALNRGAWRTRYSLGETVGAYTEWFALIPVNLIRHRLDSMSTVALRGC